MLAVFMVAAARSCWGAWDDDVYMPPTHRDPYRFKKKIELCLFIELVSGVMSVSVANAVETEVAACS